MRTGVTCCFNSHDSRRSKLRVCSSTQSLTHYKIIKLRNSWNILKSLVLGKGVYCIILGLFEVIAFTSQILEQSLLVGLTPGDAECRVVLESWMK